MVKQSWKSKQCPWQEYRTAFHQEVQRLWNEVFLRGIRPYTTVGAGDPVEGCCLCSCLQSLSVSGASSQEDVLHGTQGREKPWYLRGQVGASRPTMICTRCSYYWSPEPTLKTQWPLLHVQLPNVVPMSLVTIRHLVVHRQRDSGKEFQPC